MGLIKKCNEKVAEQQNIHTQLWFNIILFIILNTCWIIIL